jgi:acetylglutamate kinase
MLLGAGFMPVVSSIGISGEGELLNVNADDAAAGLAGVVGARALLLMTDVPGIAGDDGRVIAELTRGGVERLIESGTIRGGMIVKARAAAESARRLGAPVVILPGNEPGALARWAEGRAVGTRLVPDGTERE